MTSPIGRHNPINAPRGRAAGTGPLVAAEAGGPGLGTDSLSLSGGAGRGNDVDRAEAAYRQAHGRAHGRFKEMKGRHEDRLDKHRGNFHADRANRLLDKADRAYAEGRYEDAEKIMKEYRSELGTLTKEGIDFSKEMNEVDGIIKEFAQVQALQLIWKTLQGPLEAMEEAREEQRSEDELEAQEQNERLQADRKHVDKKQGRGFLQRVTAELRSLEQRLGEQPKL